MLKFNLIFIQHTVKITAHV